MIFTPMVHTKSLLVNKDFHTFPFPEQIKQAIIFSYIGFPQSQTDIGSWSQWHMTSLWITIQALVGFRAPPPHLHSYQLDSLLFPSKRSWLPAIL